MVRSADQPQKRDTGTRGSNPASTPLSESTGRDTRAADKHASEDDLQTEGDLAYDRPRSNTTAIRRTNLPAPRPPTAGLPRTSSPIPQRRTGQGQPRPSTSLSDPLLIQSTKRGTTKPQPPEKNVFSGKVHWLLPLGIGMIAMLVLWVAGSLFLAWSLARYDDFRYGNPRTYQT